MKPRLTTLALAGLALTGAALGQIEPLTCHGPGATHDCRTIHQPIDALAAAHEAPRDPLATAKLHLERGDAKQAREELLHALTTTPAELRPDLYFLLGLAEARLGNHLEAATAFDTVWPQSFASRYNHALARANAGDHQTAQRVLDDLLSETLQAHYGVTTLDDLPEGAALDRDTLAVTQLLLTTAAHLHYMNENPADAVTTLERLLRVAPRTPDLNRLLVTAAIDFLPAGGAAPYAQQHATADRDLQLGRAYAKGDQHEYALQHYRAAATQAMTDGDAQVLTEVAAYYAQQDQWPQAAGTAREALRHDPTNHTARTILATELAQQGKHQQAADELRLALQHGADPIRTSARLAFTLEAAGDHQAAITAAEAALEAAGAHPLTSDTPGDAGEETQYALLALLARAHHAIGELPEALAYADAATQSPLADHDMHAYAGDLAMLNRDHHAAIDHYSQADQTDPDVLRATYHAHLHLEQYEAARQAAQQLQGHPGEALHLIAWTYALDGEARTAIQAWQRAAQTDYQPAQQVLERIK